MKRILVAVDFSSVTEAVLNVAKDYASAMSAEIILLHVAELEPTFDESEADPTTVSQMALQQMEFENKELEDLKSRFKDTNIAVRTVQVEGFSGDMIVREAVELQVSMIVLGSHGHGPLWKLLVGSTAEDVLRHSPVPVLFVPVRSEIAK